MYKSSTAGLSDEELRDIPCYRYLNPEVSEQDLQQWDQWLQQYRCEPPVYSTRNRKNGTTFEAVLPTGDVVPVDWRVYRTWGNSFHLRYSAMLKRLGVSAKNPHVGPDARIAIARLMDEGLRPLTLKEALKLKNQHVAVLSDPRTNDVNQFTLSRRNKTELLYG